MINVAFVKFAGLAGGGTEKYLQTLAANLPKDKFSVDYYYTEAVPLLGNSFVHPSTDPDRLKYMQDSDVNLIEVSLTARDDQRDSYWVDTDFFDIFDSSKYHLIQTGRFGYKEFPFCDMHDSIFVDSIHSGGQCVIEKRDNIKATVLLSNSHVSQWVGNGGDDSKARIIPPIVEPLPQATIDLRESFGISKDTVVFGMHQRVDDAIFSSLPLESFSRLHGDTAYILMGGSERYRSQASNYENVFFLDFSTIPEDISNFLSSLDVYAHGRLDGEVCSASIIEALSFGLPVISHSAQNNGHQEQIEGCGFFVSSVEEYLESMQLLLDLGNRSRFSYNSVKKYEAIYSLDACIKKYVDLYEEILC